MKNSEKNDPVWKLLTAARRVEPDPFFSRNVVREVRKLQESGGDRAGGLTTIFSLFREPVVSAAAGAAAAIGILAIVFTSTRPALGPEVAIASPKSVAGIPPAEFNPAEEIENINYLSELMAVTDPADLNDAALADLYLMASR